MVCKHGTAALQTKTEKQNVLIAVVLSLHRVHWQILFIYLGRVHVFRMLSFSILVINNADLLNMLVSDDVGTYDYLPSLATGHSLEFMTSPDNYYGLAMRSILPPLRALITVAANKQQDEMNAQRQAL